MPLGHAPLRQGASYPAPVGAAGPPPTITHREVSEVHEQRELLVQEIRTAERARDLLVGLERRLKKERDREDLEEHLGHLERLAESLPDEHPVRPLVEGAVRSARARGAGYAGSAASRARSKSEGRLSWLRGSLSRMDAFAGIDA